MSKIVENFERDLHFSLENVLKRLQGRALSVLEAVTVDQQQRKSSKIILNGYFSEAIDSLHETITGCFDKPKETEKNLLREKTNDKPA